MLNVYCIPWKNCHSSTFINSCNNEFDKILKSIFIQNTVTKLINVNNKRSVKYIFIHHFIKRSLWENITCRGIHPSCILLHNNDQCSSGTLAYCSLFLLLQPSSNINPDICSSRIKYISRLSDIGLLQRLLIIEQARCARANEEQVCYQETVSVYILRRMITCGITQRLCCISYKSLTEA